MSTQEKVAVFKTFPAHEMEMAKELASQLNEEGIPTQLVDNSPEIDITFAHNTHQNEVQLIIRQSDFEAANAWLQLQAKAHIKHVDSSHYLFDFSDEELYEVLLKPDEWSAFDHQLARKILTDKGQSINDELINSLRNQRIKDLAAPEKGQRPWILFGYGISLLGGAIGIIIGWYLWKSYKTLPNGEKEKSFSEDDSTHGRNIFILGIICFVFYLLYEILWYTS